MATKRSLTSGSKFVNCEFVRRSPTGGLELVQTTNGHETISPVRATGHSEDGGKRLVVGYEPIEPRAVFVNINGDFSKVMEV